LKNEYVEKEELNDEILIENAIRGVVASTGDQFSEFLTYKDYEELNGELAGSFEGIGAEISQRDGQVVIVAPLKNSPAAKAGLRPGDIIIEVDKTSTIDFSATEVVKLIRGKKGTKVNVTVYRESIADKKVFEIVRETISIPSCDVEFTNDNIAVLRIYNFYDNVLTEFAKALETIKQKNPKGIIVDLRNNPGGYLDAYLEMAGDFFNKDEVILIEDFNGNQQNITEVSNGDGFLKNKKMVVLINGGTASAAEILAGALRDNNKVKIIGEQSFGKGSVQELMPLRDNNFLKLTVAYWLTPKGINISKKGITPDIEVLIPEDMIDATGAYEGIDLVKDIQLKKAVDELNKIIK
jgi:carboxyl-terminal processing protease